MHSRCCRVLAVTLLWGMALLLGACGHPEAQPLRFGDPVWQSGETSVYRVTDLNGEPAGTVRFEMQSLDDGGWRMERLTQTQGDEERLTVDMDAQGFRPRASSLVRTTAAGQETVNAMYDHGRVQLELTTTEDATTTDAINVPSDSRDARSLFMLIRSLPLAAGFSTKVNTFLPVAPRMTRTTVTVLGDESVETPSGAYDAWLVVLDEGDRQSRAWISKDEPYPLVKYIDAANGGVFELADFTPGE